MRNIENQDAGKSLGELPKWDLSHLYSSPQDDTLTADRKRLERESTIFAKDYHGKISNLNPKDFGAAFARFDALSELAGKIATYAFLHYALDASDSERSRFLQIIKEEHSHYNAQILFFTLEITRLDDERASSLYANKQAQHYQSYIERLRENRRYTLSEELETYINDTDIISEGWRRLFDETMADLRFDFMGEVLTETQILHLMSDRKEERRKAACDSMAKTLDVNLRLFTQITNTLAKSKQIKDRWRGFERPVSAKNLRNQVEDAVVDALITAVKQACPKLSHRYYRLKANWFGAEKLAYWNRNAPLPESQEKIISWKEAQQTVLNAYGGFSSEMVEIAARFFKEGWIDAPATPGKYSGAFAHPCVPSIHPYVLMNYQGKKRDVMTLAHELGHGIHQKLAGETQGYLLSQTPLTLAETASVFGEMLTFRFMLEQESEPEQQKIMLAGKIEDMLNTVVRQISFHEFETKLHNARKEAELSSYEISGLWMQTQKEALGPYVDIPDTYQNFWAYVPHFIHSPFYVYAYAFGDCLVNSLYALYQQEPQGFQEKYFTLLRAGGSRHHSELLRPFGLDAADPTFWNQGLAMIAELIDQLEAL